MFFPYFSVYALIDLSAAWRLPTVEAGQTRDDLKPVRPDQNSCQYQPKPDGQW
jgi:hypothetical protein